MMAFWQVCRKEARGIMRQCDYCEQPERDVQLWDGIDKTTRKSKKACRAHLFCILLLPREKEAKPRASLWFEKEK